MQLLSIGDQIQKGSYALHSSFERVKNYTLLTDDDSDLLVLATEEVGEGPTSITVAEDTLSGIQIDLIEIGEGITFTSSGKSTTIPRPTITYNSAIQSSGAKLEENLEYVEEIVASRAPIKSLAFLLSPKREESFNGAFDREFVRRVKDGVDQIFINNNLEVGIQTLKGIGPGLTPSGDDFITGLLAAVSILEIKSKNILTNFKETIYRNAKGSNPYSNTYIHQASEGNFSAKVKELLEALLTEKSKENLLEKTIKLLEFGSTSGADLATGLILGLKRSNSWLSKV